MSELVETQARCVRCGCTEESACHDKRLGTPCAWADVEMEDVCTACLSEDEFGAWAERNEL